MQKLHLVGYTTDQDGLILSARRGARSGGYQLPLSDELAAAMDEFRQRQAEAAEDRAAADGGSGAESRVESALSVRDMQSRLRLGRSIQDVAREAGVDPEWVERFADPVLAERAQVIARVQRASLRRPRLGESRRPIGEAVNAHLVERDVPMSPQQTADAWEARLQRNGRWSVRFRYVYRTKKHVLRYEFDPTTGAVTAFDKPSAQVGYVVPPPKAKASAGRSQRSEGDGGSGATRAVVTTGFRPDPESSKPRSRPAKERERASLAMRKGAAKRAAASERAAARKQKERQEAAERRERKARADAKRAAAAAQAKRAEAVLAAAEGERSKAAKKKAAQKKAAQKKAAQKKAAKKKAADRTTKKTTKKQTTRRQGAEKRTPIRAAEKQVASPPARLSQPPVKRVAEPTVTSIRQPAPPAATPGPPSSGAQHLAANRDPSPSVLEALEAEVREGRAPDDERVLPAPREQAGLGPGTAGGEPPTRPVFRPGLVEPAGGRIVSSDGEPERGEHDPEQPTAGNGAESPTPRARQRPPDRPRRTRPLRAT